MDFPAFLSLTMLRMINATIPASMSKTITVPILLPPFLKKREEETVFCSFLLIVSAAYFAPAKFPVFTFNELLSLYGRNSR
jgi:hypothetical protein